ncbi:MAG: APC family permease [Armatimonadetes bacterium]|nr:APC family permease [Armatimonadota bacterium]
MAEKPYREGMLLRDLGLLAVVATAVCTVIGGGINVLTVEIQDTVPGIDGMVPLAFVLGCIPAAFTALVYAILASAMPRAGGGYVYISRGLHPFVGFLAGFSKWWGFSVACGVVAYLDVSLVAAAAQYAHLEGVAEWLKTPMARLSLPLAMVWLFWYINLRGVKLYGQTVTVLMLLMLSGGLVIIVAGLLADHNTFAQAMAQRQGIDIWEVASRYDGPESGGLSALIMATVVLFFSYVGFDAAAQAGGEARTPRTLLPKAFLLSLLIIGGYYVLLSTALYHAAPWKFVAQRVAESEAEVSLPELMGVLLPSGLAVFVALMAALALANDIPAMLMAASRLFFAWAKDGAFPASWAAVHPTYHTPYIGVTAATVFATLGVFGCHFFGPVAMGVEAVVLALLFTYTCVALSVITLAWRNPDLHRQISFVRARWAQVVIGLSASAITATMLGLQIRDGLTKYADAVGKDLSQGHTTAWAVLHNMLACPVFPWLTMLLVGAIIFAASWARAKAQGVDLWQVFRTLPTEAEN